MNTSLAAARRAALHARAHARVARIRTYATPTASQDSTSSTRPLGDEDDPQLGDYPQLPNVSRLSRKALGWDDVQFRRNFGETLHEKEDLYSVWGPDVPGVPPATALRWFSIAVLGFVTFGTIVNYAHPQPHAVRREYPYDGLVQELGGLEENKARAEPDTEADE
ncbi:uncharacterized protein BXZ73DRAFT_37875 [Epithele typhae]|uniref:uncharacterized protein n=1 Tax=Epithele typhae TaxID=378194 RepID=UPI0020083E6C|nr:uncharacterized protein BXZ73DRAFT_37875 [Epithele typhae]KAH9945152.1 hypothetical protein BXZ73DRAFT_37875 [Epithele typhae]